MNVCKLGSNSLCSHVGVSAKVKVSMADDVYAPCVILSVAPLFLNVERAKTVKVNIKML